jgi:hypothetical protein
MTQKTIQTQSRRYSRQLVDTLMSLFALELLSPSTVIYLYSAWVTDAPILDNGFGQFRPLLPDRTGTELRLSEILQALAERGCDLRLALRNDVNINSRFLERVQHPRVQIKLSSDLHMKKLVGDHFCWEGSMNFTYSGIFRNPESIILRTDPEQVSKALLDAEHMWETLG